MTKPSQIDSKFLKTQKVISDLSNKGFDKNSFCVVPFTTVILEPNGSVGICRQLGTEFSLGNLKENTLMEIWNGEKAMQWRKEFLEGKPKICKSEIAYKNCNLCPENNQMLGGVEFSEVQTVPIQKLTANFNGKCNLQCQMCDVWEMPNGLYDELNFWGPAKKEIFPHLKEIDMLSGEPFIQKDTFRLIDEVTEVNDSCKWTITTNAHWKLNDRIISYLDKIIFKNMIISLDSVNPKTYPKIRKLGRLEVVLDNIKRILDYQEHRVKSGKGSLNIHVNFVIQKDNWREILEMIEFCHSRNIDPFITFCERPLEFSLLDLETAKKKEILDFYFTNFSDLHLYLSMRVIKPLVFSLESIDKVEYLLKIKSITSKVSQQESL